MRRDQLMPIGLSAEQLELVRQIAGTRWNVFSGAAAPPFAVSTELPHDPVLVVSIEWIEDARTRAAGGRSLERWRGVVLVPDTTPAQRQFWLARTVPCAMLVVTGQSRSHEALFAAFVRVRHDTVAAALVERVGVVHSTLVTEVLAAALFLDQHTRDVPALARAIHMHPRTLRRRLAVLGPRYAPQRLLGWALLLHVAWCMRDAECSVEHISERLGLSGGANLHRMLRSYADFTAGQLRDESRDPVVSLMACLRAELEATA